MPPGTSRCRRDALLAGPAACCLPSLWPTKPEPIHNLPFL